jgi:cytochrome bd-type quinol oxidase subunit 2
MNRLEKKAWATLGGVLLCVIIAGPGIWWMVRANTKGLVALIPFLISGLIAISITYLKNVKNWAELDEREQKIAAKAANLSRCVCILFLYCTSFIVFFVAGANNPVPAYLLPTLFISGILLGAIVLSATLLIQLARERHDE